MNRYFYLLTMLFVMPVIIHAQTTPANPINLPKDAPVEVTIADAKTGNMLSHEIVVLKVRLIILSFRGCQILQVNLLYVCQMVQSMIFLY